MSELEYFANDMRGIARELGGSDGLLLRAAADIIDQRTTGLPNPCPSCAGDTCERCLHTGRLHLAKLTISPTTDGRAVIELWQGAPGSWWPMAATPTGKDVPAVGIDGLLACLQTGGLIVDDRRAP